MARITRNTDVISVDQRYPGNSRFKVFMNLSTFGIAPATTRPRMGS